MLGITLTVKILCLGFGRNRGQVAQVVVFATIGDGFQVFGISPVGDADTGDVALFCHIHCLLFFNNGIVRKLVPGDPAAFLYKTHDPLCIGIRLRNLIQCIFYEIMIFHFCITPFGSIIYTVRSWYAINKEKGCEDDPRSSKTAIPKWSSKRHLEIGIINTIFCKTEIIGAERFGKLRKR